MPKENYRRICSELKPFLTLFLVVMGSAFLASCGGGTDADRAAQSEVPDMRAEAVTGGTVPGTWRGRAPVVNTSGPIQFNPNKLNAASRGKPLDEVDGYVTNQFWIENFTGNTTALIAAANKYSELRIIATRPDGMILIEVLDEGRPTTLAQLTALKAEASVDSIYNRMVVGTKATKGFFYSLPVDGTITGDNNWHIAASKIDSVWLNFTKGAGVRVGVLDSGLYTDHEDLVNKVTSNVSPATPPHSHGTGVVGTIAAATDNGLGISGVGWNAFVAFGAADPSNHRETRDTALRLFAAEPTIKVVNASWGPSFASNDSIHSREEAIRKITPYRNFARNQSGRLFVYAAGNDGNDARTQNGAIHLDSLTGKYLPQENVIVVAAYGANGRLTSYSAFGDTVDIAAPTQFRSTLSSTLGSMYYGVQAGSSYGVEYDDGCANCGFWGTSAAAPVVTGVVSLMLSVNPDLSPAQIKSILVSTAKQRGFITEQQICAKSGVARACSGSRNLANPIPILDAEAAVKKAVQLKNEPKDYSMAIEMSENGLYALNARGTGAGSYVFLDSSTSGVGKPAVKFLGGTFAIPNRPEMQFGMAGATFDMRVRLDSMTGMDGWGSYVSNGRYAGAIIAKDHDRNGVGFTVNGYGHIWHGTYDRTWSGGCTHDTNYTIPIGQWFRVTYTASSTTGVYGYVNNKLVWSCPGARPSFAQMNTRDLYIGRFRDTWYPIPGAVADIKIWQRALSAAEISTLN